MPELKNSFTQGRMNKDLDERIIPSTEYKEALNIGVATSEDSDVGAAQNILGNVKTSCVIQGPNGKYAELSKHITAIVDPETDMLYRFVHTPGSSTLGVWMDRIIEFDTTKPLSMPCSSLVENKLVANKEKAVLIDIYKVETYCETATADCEGGDTILTVIDNVFQIRHGMLVTGGGLDTTDEVYVVSTNLISSSELELTLNKSIDVTNIKQNTIILQADRVLNFSPNRYITGINILDGMIFWTDNYSEPKKINIERSKLGSIVERENINLEYSFQNFDQHTKLIVNDINPEDCVKIAPNLCDVEPEPPKIYGCMDPLAFNYDPLANSDIGCCYIAGCMDPAYVQYDSTACWSDPTLCIDLIVDPVAYCTNRTTLLPSNMPSTYLWPAVSPSNNGVTETIVGVGGVVPVGDAIMSLDQRLYRYPMQNSTDPWAHNAMWWLGFQENTVGFLINAQWTSATHEQSVSGLLYPVEYFTQATSGATFEFVGFHCPQDAVTWANTITAINGTALTPFNLDITDSFGTNALNTNSQNPVTSSDGLMHHIVSRLNCGYNDPNTSGVGGIGGGGYDPSTLFGTFAVAGDVGAFHWLETVETCVLGVNS